MTTLNAMSDYLENAVLNHVLMGTAMTQPTALTLALFTTSPTDASGGTEVAGGGYSRKPVTFTVTGSSATNSAEVDFGQASADWGVVSHYGVYDTEATPRLLFWGATENDIGTITTYTVNNGDTFKFPASSLTISLD